MNISPNDLLHVLISVFASMVFYLRRLQHFIKQYVWKLKEWEVPPFKTLIGKWKPTKWWFRSSLKGSNEWENYLQKPPDFWMPVDAKIRWWSLLIASHDSPFLIRAKMTYECY